MRAFLETLPAVATSPLALAGYLGTLIAWTAIALRVRRNRNLLTHLEKIPPEQRIEALRLELGRVPLKFSLSPEQWIRAQNSRYVFLAFVILCALIAVVVSIAAFTASRPGKVSFDVTSYGPASSTTDTSSTISQRPPVDLEAVANAYDGSGVSDDWSHEDPDTRLTYVQKRDENKVTIEPHMPYLDSFRNGGPIHDVSSFQWQFPKLSFKVVNNTQETILFTEAKLEVRSSQIDREPLLTMSLDDTGFSFQNHGWGRPVEPTVEFVVVPVEPRWTAADWDKPWHEYAYRFPLTANEPEYSNVDDGERYVAPIISRDSPFLPDELRRMEVVGVYGVVRYKNESGEARAVRFEGSVCFDCGRGAGSPPTYLYHVLLQAGRAPQVVNLPISQSIAPGGVDHFLLRVATDRSARFELTVTLRDAGGAEMSSNDLDLFIWAPNPLAANRLEVPWKLRTARKAR